MKQSVQLEVVKVGQLYSLNQSNFGGSHPNDLVGSTLIIKNN